MEQSRNNKGQWKRKGMRLLLIVSLVGGISLAALNINVLKWIDRELSKEIVVDIPIETVLADVKGSTMEEKVATLKEDILNRIQACESAGHTEEDGIIIYDSNGAYSLGQLQFQRKTIQHFYQELYDQDISLKEAALIAFDTEKARALASDIIWKVDGGIWNWKNCADKTGVASEITVLKKLEM